MSLQKAKQKQNQNNIKRLFIISDECIDITYLYSHFGLTAIQQESSCLRFQIFSYGEKFDKIQLYIFPRNRQFKSYCELYNEILPKPDLILYAIGIQSSIKQSVQWLNLFQKDNTLRVAFFSSARTYLQRQQILTKVNTLFIKNVTQSIYFPNIDNSSFQNCLFNISTVGISMQSYARLIPAVSRLKWIWKKIMNKKKAQQSESII